MTLALHSAAPGFEPLQVVVVVGVDLQHAVTALDRLGFTLGFASCTLERVREGRAILGRDLQASPSVNAVTLGVGGNP